MSSVTSALTELNGTLKQFENHVDVHVNNIESASISVEEATRQIYDEICKFRTDMEHGEQRQLAHENVIRIDQIIKERFSDYETIRRTVMGVVRDFDINLVRNATIQELSEELWITSSRYWLAYALLAITGWVNNYPEVAKSALAESERKDAIKTTLFFCLLNLRFERTEVAKKWFREYLKTLDPTMLQQESAVMVQAFLDGVFGKDKELEYSVIEVIDQWIAIINEDADICEGLVNSYLDYMNHINPHKQFSYEALKQYCTNVAELENSYTDVSRYAPMLELVRSLNVESVEQNDENYKDRVDAVLINLISKYDSEEQQLRDEQRYFNLIIENEGAVDTAETQWEDEMALQNESFNIGKQMIRWALYDDTANDRVRKFAIQNTKNWFKDALERFAVKLQQQFPIQYSLSIDTWSGVTNGEDGAEVYENMKNYYETNKFQNMFVNSLNIILAVLFAVSAGLAFVTLYALVVTVISLGILAFRCVKAFMDYPKRVQASLTALGQSLAEITEFRRYFENTGRLKDDILSETEFI